MAGGVTAGGGSSSNRGAYGVIGDGITNNGHGNGSGSGAMDNDYDDTEGAGSVQGDGGRGGGGGEAGMGGRRRPRWLQRASQKENGSYPDDEVSVKDGDARNTPCFSFSFSFSVCEFLRLCVFLKPSSRTDGHGCELALPVPSLFFLT